MSSEKEVNLLPHHEQQSICTSRLPYRQGRTLTAVKVYTINMESNHLLIFGVPSLNLRQEAKALLSKFGKLSSFVLTKLKGEDFTETYHAMYEKIHSARMCKKMLDTKTFYGSSLHVCYAPEYESLAETKQKLLQRRRDVIFRLQQLANERVQEKDDEKPQANHIEEDKKLNIEAARKLNMGDINVINLESMEVKKKRKISCLTASEVKYKDCFDNDINVEDAIVNFGNVSSEVSNELHKRKKRENKTNDFNIENNSNNIEIVDCTSTELETVTNINDALNYNKFGNEVVRTVPKKALNKIQFSFNNKNL